MAEPLKAVYNVSFLEEFADKVKRAWAPFPAERFVAEVTAGSWEELELKGRMRKISTVLGEHLPKAYEEALSVLYAIDASCVGFPYLFFPDFVEVYGQEEHNFNLSMQALERFTSKSSSEFAVRPFLLRDPERMMRQMSNWAQSRDEHIRRLASEGCRPRLPWGQALPMFKHDPSPIFPILEQLKSDVSLYVRKSVANNLNDIAKDNPETVLDLAAEWLGSHPHTDWIIRHGCRTLIRKAHPRALELFGYTAADSSQELAVAELTAMPNTIAIGGSCELSYQLRVREGEPVRIRIEYAIDFVKSGGRVSRKLFLLSDKTVAGGHTVRGVRQHRWANLTTRRHYPGLHRIVLLVNGRELAETSVMLEE